MPTPSEQIPGGVVYGIPPAELPELLALVHRGAAFCATNQVPLSGAMLARIRDLEVTVEAMRPVNRAPSPDVVAGVVAGVVTPLHERKVREVERSLSGAEYGLTEFAVLAGVTRQAVLGRINRGTLPARKDARGHWRVSPAALQGARTEQGA